MPVETNIANLSQTAASNSPPGSESPTTIDDYHRQALAFIAQHRDGKGFAAEVDVASAATCDIGAANSMFVRITGTTTITSFGTPSLNGPRFIRFQSALTLTHNATSLILPGGASITTAAGDTCVAVPISGGWYVVNYERAAILPAFSAYNSGTQSIGSNVQTKCVFNTERFDTASCFDSTTNYRFTPTVPGYYQINAGVLMNPSTSNVCVLTLYKNGSAYVELDRFSAVTGMASGGCVVQFNGSTDYVEVYALTLASSATLGAGTTNMWFTGSLVRAA